MTTVADGNSNGTVTNGSFHASGLRRDVDQLMDVLYAGGVNNPMDSIEQLSYLLFLRLLTEKDSQLWQLDKKRKRLFSGNWEKASWDALVTLTGDGLFEGVRAAIERLHDLPGMSATGKLLFNRATLKIYDRPTLRAVVQGINNLSLDPTNGDDPKGDMYEYLLSKLSLSGTNGQFRTPRHIIDMIVKLVDPQPGERICDPACGTGGFLVAAFNHIVRWNTSEKALAKHGHPTGDLLKPAQWRFIEEQAFTGFDNDANMVKIAILNLYLHQLDKANIEFHNPLTTNRWGTYPGKLFDVILANPPFSGKVQDESILSDLNHGINTRATESLFLKWFIDHLAPGGRAGVIVPNGVLFQPNKAAKTLRGILLKECDLQAVVSLPSGVFKPYSGVGTAVLVFRKGGPTKTVWFYEVTADGFSLDDKRTEVEANDLPSVVRCFPNRLESPRSFSVGRAAMSDPNLPFVASRYRTVESPVTHHDPPELILAELAEFEEDITARLQHVRALLGLEPGNGK